MEEFNITDFLKYYFGKLLIVFLFALLGLVGSLYYTANMQVAEYKSETKIVLANQTTDITVNDVSLNKNLIPTYREIIKSTKVLSKVIENLNLNISVDDLSKKIHVKSTNDTEIITIYVIDKDKYLSSSLANEVANIFKDEIKAYYPIENVNILDYAEVEEEAYNVNPVKQYIIGGTFGFLLGSMIVFLIYYFDDTVKTSEDVEKKIGLSVLTTVPIYRPSKKKKANNINIKRGV